jgi:tRNA(Ile)-lysidine synthetase-like protein
MSTTIIDFWREHRSFWITPPSKHHEVDKIICDKFFKYDWTNDNLIGKIIYLDQFMRHFARAHIVSENDVYSSRLEAIEFVTLHMEELDTMDEIEIIFALMPFKHMKMYDFVFERIHKWLNDRKLAQYKDLERFYIDTYKKTFTLETVMADIVHTHKLEAYDPTLICEYYTDTYLENEIDLWRKNALLTMLRENVIEKGYEKIIVSLSGGVDSMVMLVLLKKYLGANVEAVHIMYGNRAESEHEYRFLAHFCSKLGVKLMVYRIKWLRRGEIDRQFYEDMTRDLRFNVYRVCSACFDCSDCSMPFKSCVLLGHIKDDIVENIWTNIAHCHHLGNLKKMCASEIQMGVNIVRPFLMAEKRDIYEISELAAIPYFKNTTPSWSNRGKFREHFHGATVEQFGKIIDSKIIEFAEAVQAQSSLIDRLVYEPIYNSFKNNTVNVTVAFGANLDANGWLRIFEHICHTRFGISRPSIKAIRDFHDRIQRDFVEMNVELGKGLKVRVNKVDLEYIMTFIL